MDHNPLQKVEANAFEMIPQLVSLDLSHCGIKKVAAKAFAQLTSLEKLFLQHNHISELRQKTVESIQGRSTQCGNLKIFLPLRIYVKCGNIRVPKTDIFTFSASQN